MAFYDTKETTEEHELDKIFKQDVTNSKIQDAYSWYESEVLAIKRENTDYIPQFARENEMAQPDENDELGNIHIDQWADLDVVAESDEESQKSSRRTRSGVRKEDKLPKKWYICPLCVYKAITKDILLSHMLRKHTVIDMTDFVCGFCKHKETRDELLRQHLKQHIPSEQVTEDIWKWKEPWEEDTLKCKRRTKRRTKRFLPEQIDILNKAFKKDRYVNSHSKMELAKKLQVGEKQVLSWFKNKRKNNREKIYN